MFFWGGAVPDSNPGSHTLGVFDVNHYTTRAMFVVCTLCPEGENMLSRLAERDDSGARAELRLLLLLLSQKAISGARRAKGSAEAGGANEGGFGRRGGAIIIYITTAKMRPL